jgi:tripartite ATP-independent transporter DctM subunit
MAETDGVAVVDVHGALNTEPPVPEATGPRQALVRAAERWWWPANLLERCVCVLLVVAVLAGVVTTIASLSLRAFAGGDLAWANQAGVLMLNIVAFLGAAVAYRRRQFLAITWIDKVVPARVVPVLEGMRDGITLALAFVLAEVGWAFAVNSYNQPDQYLHIPEFWVDLPLCLGAWLIAIFAVERLLLSAAIRLSGVLVAAVLVFLVLLGRSTVFDNLTAAGSVWVMVVVGLVLLMLGLPLPFVFGVGALVSAYYGNLPFTVAASDLLDGTSNFLLVAIPFFLFTGFMMSAGGLSERLARAIRVLFGRVPGALLHVIVASMFVFSGISGSKIGDMAAVGSSARQMAEEEDVPVPEAVAALVAGAAMGDTVPPSIPLIVLSSVSSLSVGALFVAGILPAVTMAIALAVLIWLRWRKKPRTRPSVIMPMKEKVRALGIAVPVMVIPVFLVGAIITGIATPSEASAIAVLVSVAVCACYRSASPRALMKVAVESSVIAGVVLFIISAATLFARVLTLAEVPQRLGQLIANDHFGKWGFLVLSTIVLVAMGMIMEGVPAVLIFGPLLIPIALQLGINGLHYGIVLAVAIGIGANSPPIGVGVFVAAQIGKVEMTDVAKRLRPYLVALYIGLIAIVFIPWIVTWLPDLLHVT